MAVSQHTDVEGVQIHDEYAVIDEIPSEQYKGNAKVSDPFLDKLYPLNRENGHDEGVIPGSSRWQARQRPDGSGVVESPRGSFTYGIRTADGMVVGNSESGFWFPFHSEYYQRRGDDSGEVDEYDYDWFVQLPFQFVESVLDEFTDLDNRRLDSALRIGSDSENVPDGSKFMRGVVGVDVLDDDAEDGVLLTHTSGMQVYVGWDSTSWDNFELFGFVPFDGETGVPAPSAEDALDLLTPNEAAVKDESRVVRQGEYFLVPSDESPDGTVQKPGVGSAPFGGSPLDSHVPRDWKTGVPDSMFVRRFKLEFGDRLPVVDVTTPQDVVDVVHAYEERLESPYEKLREMAGGVFVRGSLRHRDNEHKMVSVDGWRKATTHEWDVMTQDGQRYHME